MLTVSRDYKPTSPDHATRDFSFQEGLARLKMFKTTWSGVLPQGHPPFFGPPFRKSPKNSRPKLFIKRRSNMKKLFITLLLVLVLSVPLFAAESMIASGSKSADALVLVGSGAFYGVAVATDATNAVTVSVYDVATATTGKLIVPTFVAPTSATDRTKSFFVYPGIRFENGIYVDITCAGTVGFEIYYAQ